LCCDYASVCSHAGTGRTSPLRADLPQETPHPYDPLNIKHLLVVNLGNFLWYPEQAAVSSVTVPVRSPGL
jgi:hypothetical protein